MKNILKLNFKTVLIILLLIDACFVFGHVIHAVIDKVFPSYQGLLLSDNLRLDKEGAFPEIFQYMKETAILLMTALMYWRRKNFIYLAWSFFFLFLLLDDSLQFHEILGRTISNLLNITFIGPIRGQDIGELIAIAIFGIFLLGVIFWGYFNSPKPLRAFSHFMFILLGLLISAGVFTDAVHNMLGTSPIGYGILTLVEDGGEMVVMSLMLVYVYFHLQTRIPSEAKSISESTLIVPQQQN